MNKLKIMWLHSGLIYPGGGTRYVLEAIREFSKKHDVHLYVQKSSPKILQPFLDASINVTTLSNSSTGDLSFWLNFKRQINKEIKFLRREAKNFDIVISSFFPMNIIANQLELPHIQSCFQPFAFFWDKEMISALPFFRRQFLYFMKKKFGKLDISYTKKSDRLSTVNVNVQPWIKKIYEQDSFLAYSGVDTTFFKKTPNEDLHKKYSGKKIILHSTDWTPLKRTPWLVEEFAKLNLKINNTVLLIIELKNNGIEKEKVKKIIKEKKLTNIELCGFISEELLPAYYSLADVTVYCGIGQGASAASYITLESLSCETPVVRTNFTEDEVIHGKSGYLFEKDDKENFSKYILELLNNHELNLEFGKNGRKFVEETRTWKSFVEVYEKNFEELLNL